MVRARALASHGSERDFTHSLPEVVPPDGVALASSPPQRTPSIMKRTLGILVAIALTGCAGASLHRYPHQSTRIVHPIIEGQVYQNQVVVDNSVEEQRYGVGYGSFTDDATLVTLDESQICVQVNIRNVTEVRAAQTPISAYRVFLRAHQTVREDGVVSGTTSQMATIPGTRPRDVQTGMETYCAGTDRYGNCYSWQSRPTYTTVYDPTMYQVATQSGTACWTNGGFVAEDTDEMEIYFVLPDRSDGVGFEWAFDVPAAP